MYNVTPAPSDSVLNTFIVACTTAYFGSVVTVAFLGIVRINVDGVESPTFRQRLESYSKYFYLRIWGEAFDSLKDFGTFLSVMTIWFGLIISPLFLVARVLLVIMAFTGLRSVPAGVYANIPWTQYIPHI